jgi:chemosensory pili system protein ChpA (sensor histidine kinase/response regulator)
MSKKISQEVFKGYRDEVRGYLPLVRATLGMFRGDPDCRAELAEARRQVHIIKGASAMVGLAPLSHVAYELEQLLELMENGALVLTDDLLGVFDHALNAIEACIEGSETVESASLPEYEELMAGLQALTGTLAPPAGSQEHSPSPAPEYDAPCATVEPDAVDIARPVDAPLPARKKIPQELLEVFRLEAEDHFGVIRSLLDRISRDGGGSAPLVQDLRRTVHTLKGSAGAVGFEQLAELSHRMEDLLDALYEEAVSLDAGVQQLLSEAADMLEDIAGEKASQAVLDALYERFGTLLRGVPVDMPGKGEQRSGHVERRAAARTPSPAATGDDLVRVSQDRIDALINQVGELVINRTVLEQHFSALAGRMEGLSDVIDRMRFVSSRLETEYELAGMGGLSPERSRAVSDIAEFDELEFDRYTEFHHLLRQLSETASDVKTFKNEISGIMDECVTVSTAQGRLAADIQEQLMGARMVPLSSVANRLRQIVRVVAQAQNKLVDLVIEGEHIEIDKKVLDEMVDPMMHILRNDVAHGIEPPAERLALGKNERGLIRLRAYYEGSKIVLAISDDGTGLQLERIRETSVSRGFVSAEEGAALSDDDLVQMIFKSNFSTAENVSEVSGRGIGMDVVRQQVNKLQGSLTLESSAGLGTLLTIRLPMSLSIRRTLLVTAWGESYAMPLSSLKQIIRFPAAELPAERADQTICYENESYPWVHLGRFMGNSPDGKSYTGYVPILIVDVGTRFVALQVDAVLGEREVVVKTMGSLLQRVPGVSGATVLGDGRVMLIVNPLDIGLPGETAHVQPAAMVRVRTPHDREQLTVLIVDDSVSVRQVVAGMVETSGWNALTASDGLAALEVLHTIERKPDIIILDVEMPRMDGYELLARLKSRDLWRHIPVIMLTSRAGEKHRLRALELGAAEYIIKPYQDECMRNTIRHLADQPRSM